MIGIKSSLYWHSASAYEQNKDVWVSVSRAHTQTQTNTQPYEPHLLIHDLFKPSAYSQTAEIRLNLLVLLSTSSPPILSPPRSHSFLMLLCQNMIPIQPLFSLLQCMFSVQMTLTCLRLKLSLLGAGRHTLDRPAEWNRVRRNFSLQRTAFRSRKLHRHCTAPPATKEHLWVRAHMCVRLPGRAQSGVYPCALRLLHTPRVTRSSQQMAR